MAHLKPDYFHDASQKVVLDEIIRYTVKYGKSPSVDALGVALDAVDTLNEQQYAAAVEVVEGFTQDRHDEEWLIDATDKFIRDKAVYNAIMESIGIIDDEERPNTALPDILSDALSVSIDNHIGHDYNDDVASRYDFYHNVEERLPCDLTKLNESMKGGVPRKTLNVILAGINCVHPDTPVKIRYRLKNSG